MSLKQPVTFLVPATANEPTEVRVEHSGLRMVLLSRQAVPLLDDSWRVLGVYFLLGPSDRDPDRFRAYVGEVGRRNLLLRLKEHAAQKDWWSRALLITSVSDDFNSAEIGWLEGRLWDLLNEAAACDIMNRSRPADDSLASHQQALLERYVGPIAAALRACGAPPDTAAQAAPPPVGTRRRPRRFSVTIAELIDAGLLVDGEQLVSVRRALADVRATVHRDGTVVLDGIRHPSLSAAARVAAGTSAEPGWEFWAVLRSGAPRRLYDIRAEHQQGA